MKSGHSPFLFNIRIRRQLLCAIALPLLSAAAIAVQPGYNSPEQAVAALVQAVRTNDRDATLIVLGTEAGEWIASGDAVQDRAVIDRFLQAYNARHAIARDGNRATLLIGADAFPFAFPVVRQGGRWRFDTRAGKEEMLARRIGENELSAVQVLEAIADAEREYAAQDRNGDGVPEYAQKIASAPGKRDGLYWPAQPGEPPSPLGALLAQAAGEGYRRQDEEPAPYHGYFYRMLDGQGSHAAGGALDYVVHGRTIGGFAVVAYPARYGISGVMSFIVNQDGAVYQTDLGPRTQDIAVRMRLFDPGPAWSPVKAE
jgi:hypothetical protein